MASTASKRLKKARKVRHRTATYFERLELGHITLYGVLDEPRGPLGHCDIWDVLRRAKGLGREGAKHVLTKAKVWPHTKLSALTTEERDAIKKHLPDRVPRWVD